MLSSVEKLKKRLDENAKQHEEEMCYFQALKNGCDETFLHSFDGRMKLYPLKQTLTFLELLEKENVRNSTKQNMKQWLIWLKVLVKEKPEHKDFDVWKKSIKLIENHQR